MEVFRLAPDLIKRAADEMKSNVADGRLETVEVSLSPGSDDLLAPPDTFIIEIPPLMVRRSKEARTPGRIPKKPDSAKHGTIMSANGVLPHPKMQALP